MKGLSRFAFYCAVCLVALTLFTANYAGTEKEVPSNPTRVMVRLDVKQLDTLTRESTSYKVIQPGQRFPARGYGADLRLKEAIESTAYSALHSLNGMEYRLVHMCRSLPCMALEISPAALDRLAALPEVLEVMEDKPIPLLDYREHREGGKRKLEQFPDTGDTGVPLLTDSTELIGADTVWSSGFTGSGWYVAILDTGIRRKHEFFSGKNIIEACYSFNADCPNGKPYMTGTGAAAHYGSTYTGFDHGTHVAGIAAGSYGGLNGVAKDAGIIAVNVFSRFDASDCDGSPCVMSYTSDQVVGLDYIYNLRGSYSIAAVNMSLGGGYYADYCDSSFTKTGIDNLRAVGIATVIATGNDGFCDYISAPACVSSAVAVGATSKADMESFFNNFHVELQDLFAPGSSITSATGTSDSSYQAWSGTSMATPHVTGAWALLKQASPNATVDTILDALSDTGISIDTWCWSGGSRPRIQVDLALASIGAGGDSLKVTYPNGGETLTAGSKYNIRWESTGTVGKVKVEYTTGNGTSWNTLAASTANDGKYSWTVPDVSSAQCKVRVGVAGGTFPSDVSDDTFSILSADSPVIWLERGRLNFGAVNGGVTGGFQEVLIGNSGSGTFTWTAQSNASWLYCTPASGSAGEEVSISGDPWGWPPGTYTGSVTITSPDALNSPVEVEVKLVFKSSGQDDAPFGSLDTPADGAVVSSSVPVTGWALDDTSISRIAIYRLEGNTRHLIGNASRVENARTDLETAYPDTPENYKGGWGYMLLSHFLPGGGNGDYRIQAVAFDPVGQETVLGTVTITVDNANSVNPFGAIDAPLPGERISGGSYRNSGWVLTPLPNSIPTDGSTITVYVDSRSQGHPVYDIYRSDIAEYFPGYANSNGAFAYLDLDTRDIANGTHALYWLVSDSAGNAAGIGSRLIEVRNSGSARASQRALAAAAILETVPLRNKKPVTVVNGFGPRAFRRALRPGTEGRFSVPVRQTERVEIHLGKPSGTSGWTGYFKVGDQLRPLPLGSSLDRAEGIFYWIPPAAFLGDYPLVFLDGQTGRREVTVSVKSPF